MKNKGFFQIHSKMERLEISDYSWLDMGQLSEDIELDFNQLWDIHPQEKGIVKIYGKTLEIPRWQESYIKPYFFSGMYHGGGKLPKILEKLLVWVNNLGYDEFNQVMLNWYKNGNHYIGAHSDDESQLEKNSSIVSISLGQERKFRVRDKEDSDIILDIDLPDRRVIVMGGSFQKELTHEIVKVNGKKGQSLSCRINITFRKFKE